MDLRLWLDRVLGASREWEASFGSYERHSSVEVSNERLGAAFEELTKRLRNNYPFFHPRYAGQMLKPPHPAAIAGYLAAMLINPNNHALDGGPATAAMEKEIVHELAGMFGYSNHLGHLTSSGTIANLEALYVAREIHPGKGIAYSAESHYTHSRMCRVLGVQGIEVPVDGRGRIDLGALERLMRGGRVGTVVLTAGTTGLGAVDPIHGAFDLAVRYGVRTHVDAAYGGFFTLIAGDLEIPSEPWEAISRCDSVVVDPHKHGLQPYGCGAVLFRDPSVGRFYKHDSPYTYFTSDELHLGEISLECSRPGAAAAALWLTLRVIPLTKDGLGAVLAAGRRAALRWTKFLETSSRLAAYQDPELDIVTYFPRAENLSRVDAASERVLREGMTSAEDPVFLSTLRVSSAAFAHRHPAIQADQDGTRILRSVLLKPESEDYVPKLHRRVEELVP